MSNFLINTNILSLNSHSVMGRQGQSQVETPTRRPACLRIKRPGRRSTGKFSEKIRAQIRILDVACKNSMDGSSMVNAAETGLQQIGNLLHRARELTIQAANDTNDQKDRGRISDEISQLFEEVNSMARRVEFRGKKLINGTYDKEKIHLQVGPNENHSIQFNIGNYDVSGLSLSGLNESLTGFSDMRGSTINSFLSDFDVAIDKIACERTKLSTIQMHLGQTMRQLDITAENLSASDSRIRDTSAAREMMNQTKSSILSQSATSILAQSNHQPLRVLQVIE